MSGDNNIDFNNIGIILNMLKNNKNNEEIKENNLLKINSTNNLKSILPFVTEDNENMYKILNCIEINQIINKYKQAYKKVDKAQILDLKREAILHIKQNVNENNKHIVELFLKAMEIKHIINNNYKRGDI